MIFNQLKNAGVFTAAILLCLGLAGCKAGGGTKAANTEEAANIFMTSIQSGDFATTVNYFEDGNELIHVFAAVDGESVPELDDVYRTFADQMSELIFENLGILEDKPYSCNLKITNKDYASSIAQAMDAALQAQVETGGDDFANFAGWLGAGVKNAPMGAADEHNLFLVPTSDGYQIQHTGVSDQIFFNLLTGGFYDYADLTMTTCTLSDDEQESKYYLAAIGDELIASLMTDTIPYDTASMTEDEIAQLESMYEESAEGMEGYWQSVHIGNGTITTSVGINFNTANQNALVDAGFVDGAYKGNALFTHLSLNSSIKGFEDSGMTCVTVPEYIK